jgi:SOS-response transcriptional repressor LexA
MNLTPRQADVHQAIEHLTSEAGYPPTTRQIAACAHISQSRARQHLDALERLGAIVRERGAARSVRVVHPPIDPLLKKAG